MTTKAALPRFGDLPDDALARVNQIVPDAVPVSHATWWRMVRDGRAPKPVRPSPGVTAWHVGSVREWVRGQA